GINEYVAESLHIPFHWKTLCNDHSSQASDVDVPGIQDYGIIGDCRSAALISRFGSIDWLCWPRFEKESIFAGLLDRDRGGSWQICPTDSFQTDRHYVPETNILVTRFTTSAGTVELTDAMPAAAQIRHYPELVPDHEIIRLVDCTSGEVELKIVFAPRAQYG